MKRSSVSFSTVNTENIECHIPSPEDPFCITLLQAPPGRPQRKRINRYGAHHAIPPLVWGAHYIRCTNEYELGSLLARLEYEPSLIIIRGCPPIEKAKYIKDLSFLKSAMAEVDHSWHFAQPIYQDLSSVRRQLKKLEAEGEGNSEKKDKLNIQIEEYFEGLYALGWLPRRKSVFKEVPRQWVWLDLDQGLELPDSFPLAHRADHHAALRWIAEQSLPSPFHQVSFVGQWSSSAFMTGLKVKAHFAFLLSQPLSEGALKAWHGVRGICHWPVKWDLATFRTVQPHFTAAPKFVGIQPPINERTFLVNGLEATVPFDEMSAMKLEVQGRTISGYKKKVRPKAAKQKNSHTSGQQKSETQPTHKINHQKKDLTKTNRKESPTDLNSLRSETLLAPLQELNPEVERVIDVQIERLSLSKEGERNQVLYKAACVLGRYHGGGLVTLSQLNKTLLQGAAQCGLLAKVGEQECLRQIHNGVRWGSQRPIKPSLVSSALSLKDRHYNDSLVAKLNKALKQASENPHSIPVLALTCGGGKTTALCAKMAFDAAAGLPRIVLCRNHQMAEAFLDDLKNYARLHGLKISRRIRLLEGMQRHCKVLKEANPSQEKKLYSALAYGRQALCGRGKSRCEYADKCKGSKKPKALKKGVTIATHAMGPLLDIPENAVIIIDELPTPIKSTKIKIKDFIPLFEQDKQMSLPLLDSFEGWKEAHQELIQVAYAVKDVLELLAQTPNLAEQDYGQTLDPEEALLLFSQSSELFLALQKKEVDQIPLPPPQSTRQGYWPALPKKGVIESLIELARELPDGAWPSSLSLHWKKDEAWLELRELYALPRAPLVCLDGTAHRTKHIWEHLAKHAPLNEIEDHLNDIQEPYLINRSPSMTKLTFIDGDKELEDVENITLQDMATSESTISARKADIWTIAAVGEPPLFARWIKTHQLRTSQLIRRDIRSWIHWRNRSLGTIKRIALTIEKSAQEANLTQDQSIGILAAKHVADLFRLAFSQTTEPHFYTQPELVQSLIKSVQVILGQRNLVIGHIGAHDIGSNLFHGVDLLAMLGSSKPDWGSTLSDLRALGISDEECPEVYTQLVSARDVQGLARARHLRRRGVGLLYVGDMSPPVGHDLPDVRWTQEEAAHPKADPRLEASEQKAFAILINRGFITVPILRNELNMTRARAESVCKRLARFYDLVEWVHRTEGRGRGSKAFGMPSKLHE